MTPIEGEIVALAGIEPNSQARRAYERALHVAKDKTRYDRKYPPFEWGRKTFVMSKLRAGSSILDVGVGRGYFINMVKWSKRFERVQGIDIIDHNPRRFAKGVKVTKMSVTQLQFADNEFDCVTCMEVLEHLTDDELPLALSEIRRVAKNQLIMSVPFEEPLPLPEIHKQQFTEARISSLFPDAKFSLMVKYPVNRVPWMLIEEGAGGRLRQSAQAWAHGARRGRRRTVNAVRSRFRSRAQ